GEPLPVLEQIPHGHSQTRVWFHFPFLELGVEPGAKFSHDRGAMQLVETQPLFRRHGLRQRIVAVDLAQLFPYMLARHGKVGRHLHKTTPSMSQTMPHDCPPTSQAAWA